MGSPDFFKALNATLKDDDSSLVGSVHLTPYLSLVVAIVYMMVADGEISDKESSQLQSITGGDRQVLRRALAYAERHSVEQYLSDADEFLNDADRLCILLNVCDSLSPMVCSLRKNFPCLISC